MRESFNVTYRLKRFLMTRIGDMRLLALLDNVYQVVCLPFGYLSYRIHRMLNRPYFGIWLLSEQGNPFRKKYMGKCIDFIVSENHRDGQSPKGAEIRVLEIGAYAGASAIEWATALMKHRVPGARVYSVDPWGRYLDLSRNRRLPYRIMNHALASGKIFEMFNHNVAAAGLSAVCVPIKGDSADALARFGKDAFDLVYIDGDHKRDAVKADILRSVALLKDGGLLCGDDLELQFVDVDADYVRRNANDDLVVDPASGVPFHPGVTLAVAEFFERKITCYEGFWVVRKKGGNFADFVLAGPF